MHAEVEALREKYGISYKEACHRIYHQQAEILRIADRSAKIFRDLNQSLKDAQDYMFNYEQILERANRVVDETDGGDADNEDDPDADVEMPERKDKGKGRAVE